MTLLEKPNEAKATSTINKAMGSMHRVSDIPLDFIAMSSYRSPKFPITIMDENKHPMGNAVGIMVRTR